MPTRNQTINLSAGPAHLPDEVLQQAQAELLNWHNHGTSILEISHRSDTFIELSHRVIQQLRALLNIPAHYEVLYMQGGGRLQFSMVPLNLIGKAKYCQYMTGGHWGELAATEAARLTTVKTWQPWQTSPQEMSAYLDPSTWPLDPEAGFLHITSNETVDGIQLPDYPLTHARKVAADMSSDILSRQININNYDLIYACAQKTMGMTGITFVVLNPKCLEEINSPMPSYLDYRTHLQADSMYNTPPTFNLYLSGLLFEWIKQQGGVASIEARCKKNSKAIYAYIDENLEFYQNKVPAGLRSDMNITFHLPTTALDAAFAKAAAQRNILAVKGHKARGGVRLSLYCYQPDYATDKILELLQDFKQQHSTT